jgi:fatty-acyl-CoA synthase
MEVPLTPLDFARRTRRLHPGREAVVDGNLRFTYAEFFERCDRFSSFLRRLGVGPGDRVATLASNSHGHLEAFYAVPQIGAVIVPINYRLTADDIAYILEHSGARVLCAYDGGVERVEAARSRAKIPTLETCVAFDGPRAGWLDYETELKTSPASPPGFERAGPPLTERDLLSINYTSGTTARPKGVMITHRNAWFNTIGTLLHHPMGVSDRYLWTLPMFHANGWTFVWTVTAGGGTHVCLPKVDPAAVFDIVNRERVTMLCAAPTVLIGIANAPEELRRGAPRGVRVVTAGAPPAAATIERVEGELGWTITQAYGLTETSPFITICEERPEHGALEAPERAAVKARQGVLRVVDEDGNEVPHDGKTLGEIVARGNVVMDGYYHDPEATAKAMRGGWFHSGDAAVVHPDGYVEIRDRFKDVIISGGENVSSVEVEGVLLRHPAVQEAAVVGLPHEKWGEAPHAFVVRRAGAGLTEDELCAFARERLAGFKTPKGVTFLDELPKTATGKVQKYVLRGGRAAIARQ